MNKLVKIFLSSVLLAGSSVAMATCPQHLNADEKYDCIVEEGAGDFFVESAKTADLVNANAETDSIDQNDGNSVNLANVNDKK